MYLYVSVVFTKALTRTSHESFKVGMNYAKSTVSHDAAFIASGSQDGQIYIWNSVSQEVETTLKEHG